ncbi:hypothetical protein CK204_27380, partial [Klebsiella pneumoniae]
MHEAQAAGVATLLGCDNVQDAFCPAGSYDPLDVSAARRAAGDQPCVHEAQAAGVATLLGCDNVQDAFCPAGSYDPLD